jgi:hypothetical protein
VKGIEGFSLEFVEAERSKFDAMRGRAIDNYAMLERSLCALFAYLIGASTEVAGIVFFRITNPRVRDEIIEKLLKKKNHANFLTFWRSLTSGILFPTAQKRNEIVHWALVAVVKDGVLGFELNPANVWAFNSDTPRINTDGLLKFNDICTFTGRVCDKFISFITPETHSQWSPDNISAWRYIFEQEVVYPPPSTHPTFLIETESDIPLPAYLRSPQRR